MLALQLCLKDEFRTQKNSKRESISTTSCMTRNWRHDSPENCYSIWKNTLTESRESSSPGKHIQFSHGEKLDFSFPCLEFCHSVKVFLIFNMHCSRVVPKAVSDIPKYNLLRFFPGLSDYIEKIEPQCGSLRTQRPDIQCLSSCSIFSCIQRKSG